MNGNKGGNIGEDDKLRRVGRVVGLPLRGGRGIITLFGIFSGMALNTVEASVKAGEDRKLGNDGRVARWFFKKDYI